MSSAAAGRRQTGRSVCGCGTHLRSHHLLREGLDLLHGTRRTLLVANAVQQLPQVDGVLTRHHLGRGSRLLLVTLHPARRRQRGKRAWERDGAHNRRQHHVGSLASHRASTQARCCLTWRRDVDTLCQFFPQRSKMTRQKVRFPCVSRFTVNKKAQGSVKSRAFGGRARSNWRAPRRRAGRRRHAPGESSVFLVARVAEKWSGSSSSCSRRPDA